MNCSVKIGATKSHCYKYDCGLLGLRHWKEYREHGNRIMFIISDEDDQLAWVCSETSTRDPSLIKIQRSSIYHRMTVTAMVLKEDLSDAGSGDGDIIRDFRIIAKRSFDAIDWPPLAPPEEDLYWRLSNLQIQADNTPTYSVPDLRPRLRHSIVVAIDNGPKLRLFEHGSTLPASTAFSSRKTSTCVELFQEVRYRNDVNNSSLKKLGLASGAGAAAVRQRSVSLAISEDGTMVVTVRKQEGDHSTVIATVELCVDVIGPKVAVQGDEQLRLHFQSEEDNDIVITACIDYNGPDFVDRWLISITKTNDPSVGRIFSVPASGSSLHFPIPSDVIETEPRATDTAETDAVATDVRTTETVAMAAKSSEYDVEVSALQLLDKESDHNFSRVLCKAVTKVTRPAKGTEVNDIHDLRIEVIRRSFHEVEVSVPDGIPAADQWVLTIEKLATPRATIICPRQIKQFETPTVLDDWKFEVPLHFQAGCTHGLKVEGLIKAATVYRGVTTFRAENTVDEIRTLYAKAVTFAGVDKSAKKCLLFYRNKPQSYFDDIRKHGGLMRAYDKDNSGDPGNPINLRVKGLFFMASVDYGYTDSQPIRISPFGSTRLLVPAQDLLEMAPNVYFADFFCMYPSYHYVTLVLTKTGTEADRLCAKRLLPIDINNNPFLFLKDGQLMVSTIMVSTKDHLLVEVLFTLDLNIASDKYTIIKDIRLVGSGSTTPGGIPKPDRCATCNLLSPEDKNKLKFF